MLVDVRQLCGRPGDDPHLLQYYDDEWGISGNNNLCWFEFMILEAFQAGLSCKTVNNLIEERSTYEKKTIVFQLF